MNYNILQYAFVGLWQESAPPNIAISEKEFTRGLFGDPYNTNEGFAADGSYTVSKETKGAITEYLLLNAERLQLTVKKREDLSKVLKSVIEKIEEINKSADFKIKFNAIGLIIEMEILDFIKGEEDSETWLSSNFLNKGLNLGTEFVVSTVTTKEFVFEITNNSGNLYTIFIQPRTNNPKGLYLKIGTKMTKVPDTKNEKLMFDELVSAENYIKSHIFNLLTL